MTITPTSPIGSTLEAFESRDETFHIGTSFPSSSVQLSKFLEAPNADELVKDLAKLVSHRGVVFFTDQDITIEQQKQLGLKLGKLSTPSHPETSGLHKHPISEDKGELGADISIISSMG
jgi:hypothetical protein